MRKRSIITAAVLATFVVGTAVVHWIRSPRLTPELRGYALARDSGCFNCHGPDATGGVPNPGSEEVDVPAWDGGTAMMYVESEDEIREWIMDGHPKRLAHQHDDASDHDNRALLDMPQFRDVLSASQLEDIVAYYKAVAVFDPMPADVREGHRVAKRAGCFGCHGPGGLVGMPNPRSFKGYIPPWRGRDYEEMVKGEDELRQWILDGRIDRFESNALARHFTGRQVVQMPAYRDRLGEDEIDALLIYIAWLQSTGE
jgi:mono/diheme cytochrome c family protein